MIRSLGVVRYLSDEWIQAADRAVRAAAAIAPAERLVIDQHIDGASSYRVIVERDACSVTTIGTPSAASSSEAADAAFRQSVETAQAVAQGATDAHQAFLLGHITFVGDVDVLIARRDAFAWLEAALAPVMADTTFG